MNGQKIAQRAHAALRALAAIRNRRRCRITFGNRGENLQLHGRLQRLRLVIRIHRVEEALRCRLLRRRDAVRRLLRLNDSSN
jgi:hypothetical protein